MAHSTHTPHTHTSCTHLGARTDWGGHPTLVTAGTYRQGRWVRQAGLGSSRPVIARGRSAGTVQDVIHTVTASQWEGPEQEEKTVGSESKNKEQGAAQVLATTHICGMSLDKTHVTWTGPATSTFEKMLHVLREPPRVNL